MNRWLAVPRDSIFPIEGVFASQLKKKIKIEASEKNVELSGMKQPSLPFPFIVLPVRSRALPRVKPPPISPDQGGRSHTDLRWSTPNQTSAHRPAPPSWASNGSPGHPGASPAPTRTSSSAPLIIGSSRPRSPSFSLPGTGFLGTWRADVSR